MCHLREWGQEEFAGQQETVPYCMPNIVHSNVWTTFLITSVLNPQFFVLLLSLSVLFFVVLAFKITKVLQEFGGTHSDAHITISVICIIFSIVTGKSFFNLWEKSKQFP